MKLPVVFAVAVLLGAGIFFPATAQASHSDEYRYDVRSDYDYPYHKHHKKHRHSRMIKVWVSGHHVWRYGYRHWVPGHYEYRVIYFRW